MMDDRLELAEELIGLMHPDGTATKDQRRAVFMLVGENIARDIATDDAPKNWCMHCVNETPLAYNNASDLRTIKAMRQLVDDVCELLNEGDDPYFWVRQELYEAYENAYYNACADLNECEGEIEGFHDGIDLE